MEISWVTVGTPLPTGSIQVAVTADGVLAATFGAQPVPGISGLPEESPCTDAVRTAAVRTQFAEYFAGRRRTFGLPIDWRLTSGAQRTVLQTLQQTVPYGETVTYGELARRSGLFEDTPDLRGPAARAVGSIMGSCSTAILVPCHRVVAADGIGGFGGGPEGLEVKRWLLTLEGLLEPTLDWNGPG